jgi:alginate O-acetyltransferase complex protein AlgI
LEKAFLLKLLGKLPKFLSHVYALIIIVPGWVIFYFTDTAKLGAYFEKLFSFGSANAWNLELTNDITANLYWLIFALLLCMPVYHKVHDTIENRLRKPAYFQLASLGLNFVFLFLCVAQLVGKSYNPFIYFRF